MQTTLYEIRAGKLKEIQIPEGQPDFLDGKTGEKWFDVQEQNEGELREFLKPLNLHPLQLSRCLDTVNSPGVISFDDAVLMEYPAAFNRQLKDAAYLSIILKGNVLVTIRHGVMPALDELINELKTDSSIQLNHLPQLIYLILDEFADLNAEAQVEIRDQIQLLSNTLAENPLKVNIGALSDIRSQLENMVSLVENQFYCISGLNASDNESLKDPHRKAYIEDILSETELTQRGVYRLESRVRDLYGDYQALGNDRVEKRLRLLTIVSAITLPLGLIAGLLGMNVGGVPGLNFPYGFVVVVGLMVVILFLEYLFFKRKGWFD